MILSNKAIVRAIREKKIGILPYPPAGHFNTSALDLRVGDQFFRWRDDHDGSELIFDLSTISVPACGDHIVPVPPESDGRIKLKPGAFMLAKTLEIIDLAYASQLAARVEGRSSLARLGLQVHMTAPTIHCGFKGPITLELKNCGGHSLMITPNETCICQLIFETVKGKPEGPFASSFLNQKDPLGRH